ncbi:His-Xaa-Ser system protein HxsD [Archangium sp.]|uniref:His-Xaa-Ser system protein HxsD n=1 Tax=Archangium sp. TaxID=1872627 RepID=UPI003899D106
MTTREQDAETRTAFVFRNASVQVTVDMRAYRLAAVQKTAYKLAERCTAVIGAPEGNGLPITFVFRPETVESDALEVVRLFFQELLDQELREQIGDETRAVRALILAQAFSRTNLIRHD